MVSQIKRICERVLTNMSAMKLRGKVLKHEFRQSVTGENEFANYDAPFCCVAFYVPILVRPRVGRVEWNCLQRNHLPECTCKLNRSSLTYTIVNQLTF